MRPLHIRLQEALDQFLIRMVTRDSPLRNCKAAAKGWKAADVARQMPEVAASTVGHWFAGRRQPQMDHLRKLAQILEISAAALVADEPDYAHTIEERLALQMMRDMNTEQREAFLAIGKTVAGVSPRK